MACFVVPLTQAIATTACRRHADKNSVNPFVQQLPKLELMLWGGSIMLVLDHIISGEVIPFFPFFSALLEEGGWSVMWREMLTVGLPMSLLVTGVWAVSVMWGMRRAGSKAATD